ncbi:hypothetical protein DHX103_03995 [Planococcus sp. X10-3]|uniref:hypothetical protein n=1 Tax=Planococcus sp. X10-3 TaxID=3061240 RepID=UPI003BAF44F6
MDDDVYLTVERFYLTVGWVYLTVSTFYLTIPLFFRHFPKEQTNIRNGMQSAAGGLPSGRRTPPDLG